MLRLPGHEVRTPSALEPPDDFPAGQELGRTFFDIFAPFIGDTETAKRLLDIAVGIIGTETGVGHAVASGMTQQRVPDKKCHSKSCPTVAAQAGYKCPEWGVPSYLSQRHAVIAHPTGEAKPRAPDNFVQAPEQPEQMHLETFLKRGSQVAMKLADFSFGLTRGAENLNQPVGEDAPDMGTASSQLISTPRR